MNILRFSSLYKSFYDGTLKNLEAEAAVVPYSIGTDEFNKIFFLTDGIYPCNDRFVKPIAEEVYRMARTGQEGYRTRLWYIEKTWHFVQYPIRLLDIQQIGCRVSCVLIAHNMIVSDRIMECRRCKSRLQPQPCPCTQIDNCSSQDRQLSVHTNCDGFAVHDNESDD